MTEILNYDYFNDDAWLGAVGVALHTLHHQHKFSGNASFIIPGNQVLTKTIRIPHVEESKRAQIIAFEAQQNIPYPLHEVVWDSQVVGDDGVETEVLFIACKSNTIEDCGKLPARVFQSIRSTLPLLIIMRSSMHIPPWTKMSYSLTLVHVLQIYFSRILTAFSFGISNSVETHLQNIADSIGKPFAADELKHKF